MAQQHSPDEETFPEQQQKQPRHRALCAGITKRPMPARLALAAALGTLLAVLVWGLFPYHLRAQVSTLDSRLHTTAETPLTHSELNRYPTHGALAGQQAALVLLSDPATDTKHDHNGDVNVVITSSESPPPPPAPVVPQPAPVIPQPIPVIPQPAPVVPQPAPVIPQPAPVVPQPIPVVPQPTPVLPQPTPEIPHPTHVFPHPHIFPHPTPVVPQPIPVIPQPAPVIPEPIPVVPQPIPVIPQPALEQVPNLIGHDLATAEQLLAQKGLTVGTVIHQGSGEPTGTVLQTNPGPNTLVQSGSAVDLFVAG